MHIYNQFVYREGTALVMLAKQLLRVCLLSLNQDIHWREGTALVMLAKQLLRVCLLSLNQDIHWREGTALVMLAKLLLWAYSLWIKIYIEGKVHALVVLAKLFLWVCLLSLNQDIHWREGTALVMLAKLFYKYSYPLCHIKQTVFWVCFLFVGWFSYERAIFISWGWTN